MTGNIGKNVKKRLIELDKTAKELAEYAGISECHMSRMVSGKRDTTTLNILQAIKMADFLQMTVYELISPPEEDVVNGSAKYGLY
jgi:DNA-binding Xre family transcriptional regulator